MLRNNAAFINDEIFTTMSHPLASELAM